MAGGGGVRITGLAGVGLPCVPEWGSTKKLFKAHRVMLWDIQAEANKWPITFIFKIFFQGALVL